MNFQQGHNGILMIGTWNLEPGSKQPQLLSVLVGADTLDTGEESEITFHSPLPSSLLRGRRGDFQKLDKFSGFCFEIAQFRICSSGCWNNS